MQWHCSIVLHCWHLHHAALYVLETVSIVASDNALLVKTEEFLLCMATAMRCSGSFGWLLYWDGGKVVSLWKLSGHNPEAGDGGIGCKVNDVVLEGDVAQYC